MPRYHFHDNLARRATITDQEAESMVGEIMQRIAALEEAVAQMQGNGGNGEPDTDQYPGGSRVPNTYKTSGPQPGTQMGDELLTKGNLSRAEEMDQGMVWPRDKGGKGLNYTGDSHQVQRDKFLSRNASHPGVVDINSRNRAFYNR